MPRSRVRWCEGPCSLATSGGGGTDADGKAMTGEGDSPVLYRVWHFFVLCSILPFSLDHTTRDEQRRARSWTVVTSFAPKRRLDNARSVMRWPSATGSSGG